MKILGALSFVLLIGFLFGFLWGARTRAELPSATETDFSGGTFTLKVNASRAVSNGLFGLFR